MQVNVRKSLNSKGRCCEIKIDELEDYFVKPFSDVQSRQKRLELCNDFREWLKLVSRYEVISEIWINGLFATHEMMPKYVEVACVAYSNRKLLSNESQKEFNHLIKEKNWYIIRKYHCSVEVGLMFGDYIEKYGKYWFGDFKYDDSGGKPNGIFKITLL